MASIKPLPPRSLLAAAGIAVVLLGLTAAFVGFRYFRAEVLSDLADDRSFRASLVQVTPGAGQPPLLTLDAETLRSGVIASQRLEAVDFQPSVPAVGSAVDPVDLAGTRDRLVEAGEAGSDPDAVRLRRAVALALYGPGLTDRMNPGDPELAAILQYRASLLLLTPLPGYAAPLPEKATARGRGGEPVEAHLLSVAYRIDPRFQNIAALYRTAADPADPHFLPGPAYSATLPVGPVLAGVVIPAAAVLQAGGKAWAYVEESPRRFRRRELSLAHALPDGSGWFENGTFQAGQNVVVAGAALLLEEE